MFQELFMVLKKYCFYPILFVVFSIVFFVFANASIGQIIYPFAVGLMFALVWVNQKVWIVCPAFLLAVILANWSIENVITSIICCLVLVVPYYIHILLKKNIKVWEMAIFVAVSQIYPIINAILSGGEFYFDIISMLASILFYFVCINILEVVFSKGLVCKLSLAEMVCGGIFLCCFSSGLVFLNIEFFSFLKMFVAVVLLVSGFCFSAKNTVLLAVLLGSGTMLATDNPVFIAPFVIWGLFLSCVKVHKKILMPIALILAELLVGFYFNLYYSFSFLHLVSIGLSIGVFLALPSKIYERFSSLFATKDSRSAVKDVVNRNREILKKRLSFLSEVFNEMNIIFKKMVKKNLSKEQLKSQMKREIRTNICAFCPDKNHCERAYTSEMDKVFDELSQVAFQRGKVSILDIPNFLSAHCNKVTNIISATNTLCDQYKRYSSLVGKFDTSKLLIADQMGGISNVLKNLSKETGASISFDNIRENKISEELLFNDVICDDVIVYENGIHSVMVSLSVRNEDKEKLIIPKIVGKICGGEMIVNQIISSTKPAFSILNLSLAPKYDCTFGLSTKIKTGSQTSGDCHSILKLEDDKYLFALCDGMGSGERAKETSENAISLIENFYKAGFDNELILSNVNKLLTLQKDDIFSALDICVVDLKNACCSIVKMGSPSGFLINKKECRIIESGALPLGIVDESQPLIKKVVASAGDFLILTTDGISDSFESDEALASFVCSLKDRNPQSISDKIMQQALLNSNNIAQDDMSVLVLKIY